TYKTLLTFFPDSLDYGLALGNAQLAASQSEAARATARKLRQLPAPDNQDPRLDILEARTESNRNEAGAALALLEAAAGKGRNIGAPLLVARADLEAAYVLADQGQHERARKSAAAAQPIFLSAGDRGAAADALIAMSIAYAYQDDLTQALGSAEA